MQGQREPQMLIPMETAPAVGRLRIAPCSLAEANDLVARWHRHHAPAPTVIRPRFAMWVLDGSDVPHGAVIVANPVARMTDHRTTCEVARLVTDGTPHACSMLYGAAARVAREMGYRRIQTFTLEEEPGTSLRASGWVREMVSVGGDWTRPNHPRHAHVRTDQPLGRKVRWSKTFGGVTA